MTTDARSARQRAMPSRDLAVHLQRARDSERAHLARELHDELGAILTAAKLELACLRTRFGPTGSEINQRFEHLNATLNSGLALKSRIVEGLCPSSLARMGLQASLAALVRDFSQGAAIPATCTWCDVALAPPTQLAVYRLVQECLTNIGKYAGASRIEVSLLDAGRSAVVMVFDNGVGFDVARTNPGQGLAGMRQRIAACGGQLRVVSCPGKGTRIVTVVPKLQVEAGGTTCHPGEEAEPRQVARLVRSVQCDEPSP
ncbi:sensor histidine kinase [Variovorax soli]|uniref:Signal transduction histidine kinase n=1 Tax=Variovorax soli TaxID=376815 RepID=A0ABU1NMK1_9BURK|nr:sensor histidine kinase [Variovorax soli]MDR6539116.1 signal transduction histidine kinase [Variovorax soli]